MKNTLPSFTPHISVLFGLAICILFLAGLPVDAITQFYLSLALLLSLLIVRHYEQWEFWRVLFLALSSFIVLRYFLWRTFYTLGYNDFFSYIGSIVLYLAEIYGVLMFFLSSFVNIRPLKRDSIPLPQDISLWPTVDVLIPSYNEPLELVKITLAAASNIDYPQDKLNIYLLDDGGTDQKLNAKDEHAKQIAVRRRADFMALCNELGIHYLTRSENQHAKAGNMNAALVHIHGDLILVLDADHAPTTDILYKTVGSFIEDKKVFLVQTPHFFINPDPVEKNLTVFHRMPPENFMFYGAIQLGLDFWHSSFFCGSAAVLRRVAIDEIGGFKGKTITEDSETALMLHCKGWKSHYVMHPLISGLQPETFSSFMLQRIRWAQGMVQNFIFHNPLLQPKLRIWQKISYLSNMLFWFFPFARLIYLFSPGLYLLFGLKIYNANSQEFFGYAVPYLLAMILTNHYLFRKVRWTFVSEIYELLQSLFSIRAIWAVLKDPTHPQFAVTPKMETLDRDFISPLSKPFYWSIVFAALLVVFGIWRCFAYPDQFTLIAITLFWAIFNLLLLLSALGALYEQKQRRGNPRFPVSISAVWVGINKQGIEVKSPVTLVDLSTGGTSVLAHVLLNTNDDNALLNDKNKDLYHLDVTDPQTGQIDRFNITIANQSTLGKQYLYGIRFEPANIDEYRSVVRLVHGHSDRWVKIQQDIGKDPGLVQAMLFLPSIGLSHGINHLRLAIQSFSFRKNPC